MRKSLDVTALALLIGFLVAGCPSPEATSTTGGAPALPVSATDTTPAAEQATTPAIPVPPAPAPIPADPVAKASAQVADTAFNYGTLALNSPAEYGKALKSNGGCDVAKAFSDALGSSSLGTSLPGKKPKDEDLARDSATEITEGLTQLEALCGAGGTGSAALAKQLILDGLSYRSALGLPAPKKAI